MSWIKKYVYLNYQCSNKEAYFALGWIAFMEIIMFPMIIFRQDNDAIILRFLTVFSYCFIMMAVFSILMSTAISQSLKINIFFRSSRKRYYISVTLYTLILSILFSVIQIVPILIYGLIYKNSDVNQLNNINFIFRNVTIGEVFGQFICYTLLIFLLTLILNIIIAIMLQYGLKYFFAFLVVGIGIYALDIYKGVISYLENGNLIVIDCVFLAIIALVIYSNWLLIKKIDIKD